MGKRKNKFSLTRELKKLSKGKRPSAADKARVAELLGHEVGGTRPGTWPHTSLAMGVHPDQVDEANALLSGAGLKAYHAPGGELITPDAAERKRVLKFKGMTDFAAFS